MSSIIVFGGAGRTGSEVVKQAISNGHSVTAFTYSTPPPGMLPDSLRLRIVTGNAYVYDDVARAVAGHDVVINIIAPKLFDRKNYPISEQATRNIIHAMHESGIRRYIGQAGAWATDQIGDASLLMRLGFMFFLPLKNIYSYKKKEDQLVKQSQLDWTLVRCGILTDKHPTSHYKIYPERYVCGMFEIPKIRRVNVAKFELSIIHDTAYYKKCPIVIE